MITTEEFNEWFWLQQTLKTSIAREQELRKKLFQFFFPNPKEGTNRISLDDTSDLTGTYILNRAIDVATLHAITPEAREMGISFDNLITWAPTLSVKAYRGLTESQRQLFDRGLTIKPGMPQLAVVTRKP